MHRVVRLDLERIEEYRQRLREFAGELRRRHRVSRIILFGSFARGEVHEGSDIDLVVVGDFPERFIDRIGTVLGDTRLPIEPWVYTDAEWNEMVEGGSSFAEEVLETGVEV